jgi:hypothetical protein
VPTIPGNYLFQKEGRSCRERYVWAGKRIRRKGEKNDIKSNRRHDVLFVGNFMFQLASKCAVAYTLFFFNFHVQGPWPSFDTEYILKL